MGSSQAIAPKYIIYASFEVEGVVEKPDVIGAIFGQTEGLFGPELDLRELQKTGRIGRIEIQLESKKDLTKGQIIIPSSLDKPLTALISGALESVDRIGPCAAKVIVEKIEDFRKSKRDSIVRRAREILVKWTIDTTPTLDEIMGNISDAIKIPEIVNYGPEGLPAGPDINSSKSIIIVEGRADISNLLKAGKRNVIATNGTKIPETIKKLSKEKEITALLDGDRGGDLILEELLQVAKVDFVSRAPRGKEIEELSSQQILKILDNKIPLEKIKVTKKKKEEISPIPDDVLVLSSKIKGTLEAAILNEKIELIERLPVSELCIRLQGMDNANIVIFDGIITQRLVETAENKKVKYIIGERISSSVKESTQVKLLTLNTLIKK